MLFFGLLCSLLCLVVALLCIPLRLQIAIWPRPQLQLSWLFLTKPLYPSVNHPKKPKATKSTKPQPQTATKAKPSLVAQFYAAQGLPGYWALAKRALAACQTLGGAFLRCLCIRSLTWVQTLPQADAHQAALCYGKACARVLPLAGYLTTHIRTKPQGVRIQIHPNFAGFFAPTRVATCCVSATPARLIACLLGFAARLLCRVLVPFLRGAKRPRPTKE